MPVNQVNIREVIAHGLVFDLKNAEALQTMDWHNLLAAIPRLFELLEQGEIEYVLVGGIAMLMYVPGRNTQDIDIIVSMGDMHRLPELRIEDQQGDVVRGRLGDLQIDLWLTDNQLFDLVRREHTVRQRFAEREIPCASVEGLVLLKLYALPSLYRQGQFDRVELYEHDVAMLMRSAEPKLPPILERLAHYLSESDLLEVRDIVHEIELRLARAPHRFHSG